MIRQSLVDLIRKVSITNTTNHSPTSLAYFTIGTLPAGTNAGRVLNRWIEAVAMVMLPAAGAEEQVDHGAWCLTDDTLQVFLVNG